MTNLFGALSTAAEEARRLEEDLRATREQLESTRCDLYNLLSDYDELKDKVKSAGNLFSELARIFKSD